MDSTKSGGVTHLGEPTPPGRKGAEAAGGGDNGKAGAHGGESAPKIGVDSGWAPTPPSNRGAEAPPGGGGGGVVAPPLATPVEPPDSEFRGYFFVIRGLRRKVG